MNKIQGWVVAVFSVLAVTVAGCGGSSCPDGCNCGMGCQSRCPCEQPQPLTDVDAAR